MLNPYEVWEVKDEQKRIFPGGAHSLVEDMDTETMMI